MAKVLKNLVGGEWVTQSGNELYSILNPADRRTVVAELRYSTPGDVGAAVQAALRAFPAWRNTPVVQRCRILFHCKELLEQRMPEISRVLVEENGKTIAEAEGSIRRGIEVVEFAAGMPSLMKGDYLEDIASRVDGYLYREPLGVVAGACPFNFPAMIPLWMFPVAVACGNAFVLKPSEKCPVTATLLAEIFMEGGLPPGVLNVVQGAAATFEALITNEHVQAVSFVGSTAAARHVWELATAHHKRVQALGGAKNYIVVMPDADLQETVKAILSSSFGCAGERCMASSVVVVVGQNPELMDGLKEATQRMKLGSGLSPETEMGPLISKEHKQRVEDYIRIGVEEGAQLVVDGREINREDLADGNFLAPTIFDDVRPEMKVAREEIFGPVLSVMHAETLSEAIDLANQSSYGNGASIFTSSGGAAREFKSRIQCGMIGINAGVPAPMAFFSFGGQKNSLFGDLRAQGTDAVEFYTRKKAIIERWAGHGETGNIWAGGKR